MATAAELKEQLRAKMANSASTESTQPQQDRFIKGTLIDDKAIAFFQKLKFEITFKSDCFSRTCKWTLRWRVSGRNF